MWNVDEDVVIFVMKIKHETVNLKQHKLQRKSVHDSKVAF